jgi:hypothetical protein
VGQSPHPDLERATQGNVEPARVCSGAMRIGLDFDGTLVLEDRPYADLDSPVEWIPGAREGVIDLHAHGHRLLLWSARMSRALIDDWRLCPDWAAQGDRFDVARWEASRELNAARVVQMLAFLDREVPGLIEVPRADAGKPLVDLFIDDRSFGCPLRGGVVDWHEIRRRFGQIPDHEL